MAVNLVKASLDFRGRERPESTANPVWKSVTLIRMTENTQLPPGKENAAPPSLRFQMGIVKTISAFFLESCINL